MATQGPYTGFRGPGLRLPEAEPREMEVHGSVRERPFLPYCHWFDPGPIVRRAEEGLLDRPWARRTLGALREREARGLEAVRRAVGGRLHLGRFTGDLGMAAGGCASGRRCWKPWRASTAGGGPPCPHPRPARPPAILGHTCRAWACALERDFAPEEASRADLGPLLTLSPEDLRTALDPEAFVAPAPT